MAPALGIRRCKCVVESFFICKKHEKTACFAAVAGMKPTKQRLIVFDEGLQCALPDIVRELIDALEIFEDPFAHSFGQYLNRCFHQTQKIRGLSPPIDALRKMDRPSAEIFLQVRWLHSPQETWQAKAQNYLRSPP